MKWTKLALYQAHDSPIPTTTKEQYLQRILYSQHTMESRVVETIILLQNIGQAANKFSMGFISPTNRLQSLVRFSFSISSDQAALANICGTSNSQQHQAGFYISIDLLSAALHRFSQRVFF